MRQADIRLPDQGFPAPLSPGFLAQCACLLEVTARKAGNVHRERDFDDAHYVDFLLGAAAITAPLDRARAIGIGPAVLEAVRATRRVVATNTNLGSVLLLAPLAAVPENVSLEIGIGPVLAATTVADAREVYEAIRLAQPGGLGTVAAEDVAGTPTVTLLEAMRLASKRDLVALQYANAFAETFGLALPALRSALAAGRPLEQAIIFTHLTLLARCPDTLIARKLGVPEAAEAARLAAEVLAAGWPDSPSGCLRFEALDAWLRARGHARNPGTTADLVAAALFAALRDGTIRLPKQPGAIGWEC
ncbi:MAG TPA: triphosphoribosyl-dephospho-CoA synthase [Isosphaeraceae bacterium]|jgi:triphosphoribosyl-dephospho-CoA synthase|nr:triphosphoribosyl-dephospho-CoA synthase [Isosphaeraceae bacterium]